MSTKHVVNEPRELVNEALRGLVRINPNIRVDEANRVVLLNEVPQDRVALVRSRSMGVAPFREAD